MGLLGSILSNFSIRSSDKSFLRTSPETWNHFDVVLFEMPFFLLQHGLISFCIFMAIANNATMGSGTFNVIDYFLFCSAEMFFSFLRALSFFGVYFQFRRIELFFVAQGRTNNNLKIDISTRTPSNYRMQNSATFSLNSYQLHTSAGHT